MSCFLLEVGSGIPLMILPNSPDNSAKNGMDYQTWHVCPTRFTSHWLDDAQELFEHWLERKYDKVHVRIAVKFLS